MKRLDKLPLFIGLAVAGAAAVVASATTLAALARGAGWTAWTPWLLPASLDVGTAVGVWCWLRPGAPDGARSFARRLAVIGSIGTLLGNASGHLLESSLLQSGPVLVVVVGAAPAAVLVALAHLAALLVARPADPILVDPIGSTQERAVQPAPPLDPATAVDALPSPAVAGANPIGSTRSTTRSTSKQPTRSTTRSDRSDDDLRIELAALVDRGDLPASPAAEPIRTALGIAPAKARMLRDELKPKQDQAATEPESVA